MQTHDAFGRLLVDPDELDQAGRVDVVRSLAGQLQASPAVEMRWLGRVIVKWLQEGEDLVALLGLRPARGSRATAQRQQQLEPICRLLLRLSVACNGDRAASRVLRGQQACPAGAASLVAELNALKAPKSPAAFTRARQLVSRNGR